MPSSHLILCLLPLISPSIRVFSNESALRIKWPKYWSFSFSNSEYSGLISFRIDWFDLVVQGTRKSLLQHHNLKASILRHSNVCLIKVADAGDVADVRSRSQFGASLAVGRLAHWQRRQRRAGNASSRVLVPLVACVSPGGSQQRLCRRHLCVVAVSVLRIQTVYLTPQGLLGSPCHG